MKNKKKVSALFLAVGFACLAALAGCGGQSRGTDVTIGEDGSLIPATEMARVQVWAYCDGDEATRNRMLTEAFNEKYKEYNISANFTQKPSSSYETTMKPTLSGENGPDVFLVSDTYYKQWATLGLMENLDPYITHSSAELNMEAQIADMFENSVGRYRYDVNTTTDDGADAHYYGLPKGSGATAIYYNKDYLENAGVKIISVYETELDAFNAGGKDAAGNTKASLGISGTVKAVGYDTELKVFNNRISMNWEECATLAALIQNNAENKKAGCKYGFLTSWWFNYGFSVGGSCIGYVPTADAQYNGGYYTFTLADATINYRVQEGKTLSVNGTQYQAGEIISYYDKFFLTDALAADCDILPSQRQSFVEYLSLSAKVDSDSVSGVAGLTDRFNELIPYKIEGGGAEGEKAYEEALRNDTDVSSPANIYREVSIYNRGVSPNPSSFSTDGRVGVFISGITGMVVEVRASVSDCRNIDEFDWDVAPMLVYRGEDADGKEVEGIAAAHSGSTAWCVWSRSKLKTAAYLFVRFAASEEGQRILADAGTIVTNQKSIALDQIQKDLDAGLKPANAKIFADQAEYQTPGDWWFLSDGDWIDEWASVVNNRVRNGSMSFSGFLASSQYKDTFATLLKYTRARS